MGSGARGRRDLRASIGDIVAYRFPWMTAAEDKVRLGYITSQIKPAPSSPIIYEVKGFDGEEYQIHEDYIKKVV